jgi:hypothetical protein
MLNDHLTGHLHHVVHATLALDLSATYCRKSSILEDFSATQPGHNVDWLGGIEGMWCLIKLFVRPRLVFRLSLTS